MYNKDWLREYGQGMFRVKEASWVEAWMFYVHL